MAFREAEGYLVGHAWRNRTFADVGALALAASILFAGSLSTVTAQAAPAAAVSAVSAQAAGAESAVIEYVARGDSYAAGQGAGSYENACMQSALSYPEMLDDVDRVELVADASCSGATTRDVLTRQLRVVAMNRDADLVTVTVGANDLGGAAVVAACSTSFASPECQAALDSVYALLTPRASGIPSRFAIRLTTALTGVAMVARDAKILVTGYPYLFETPPPSDPNYAAIVEINSATALLNATIQGVVQQLASRGVDIRYVDVTEAFTGHGIGSPDPWIHASGPDAFHPTAAGYVAYTMAITSAL
ncbi:SGNH/GDSL hydrolase family protein [Mycetocola miduiensis]|uniref:SGNH/GDSL hydrolase family protein n=1 Tax=Mycetocola miduiensis TaxID=995034 RepID=UPI0015A69430|nr:SGNH/GDSL hydrolase family protein [Mycetocola miduiensis]